MTCAPSLEDCTNTFVLSSTPNSAQVLFEVPKALDFDPARRRRAHRKSRAGCENCRRRRVKCDEGTPCDSCIRRKECCLRPRRGGTAPLVPSMSSPALVASNGPADTGTNLLHMRLFHHFQTRTRHTLVFGPEIWANATQLCFHFDFLMDAVLCVAARHLSVLKPEDTTYPAAAASHICRSLSKFRQELSSNFTAIHMDAFIAASFLFQYETWANTDVFSPRGDGSVSATSTGDRLFTFGASLKQVFLQSVPLLSGESTIFMPHVPCDPTEMLVAASRISKETLSEYHDFFSYRQPLTSESLDNPPSYKREVDAFTANSWDYPTHEKKAGLDPIENGYVPAVSRLCLMLSFLPEAQPPSAVDAKSPYFPHLTRYMLSFPIMCYGIFTSMLQRNDPHGLLLLYHFYRAARVLLPPDECWWAGKRAAASELALKEWLVTESIERTEAKSRL